MHKLTRQLVGWLVLLLAGSAFSAETQTIRLLPSYWATASIAATDEIAQVDLIPEPMSLFFGFRNPELQVRSSLEYSLEALPANAQVVSAILEVRVFGRSGDFPFVVGAYSGDGTFASVDWMASTVGGPFAAESVGEAFFIDGASASASATATNKSVGFVFSMLPCRPGDCWVDIGTQFVRFPLNPVAESSYFPYLNIAFAVPEPASVVLLLGALPLIYARTKRTKSSKAQRET